MQGKLYELRSYDFAPGDATRYIELFRREGLPLITAHLPLAGYWLTEVGPLNQMHHLWVYDSLADRAKKRATFMADRAWTEGFLPRGMAFVKRQESRHMRLIEGSAQLDAVLASLGPHASEAADAPLFGESWWSLAIAGTSGPAPHQDSEARQVARWQVVLGADAGAGIAFTVSSKPDALLHSAGMFGHLELVRPLNFSPLR